jgi:hypothetical protein
MRALPRKRYSKKFRILTGIRAATKRKNISNNGNKSNFNLRSRAKYDKLNLRARPRQKHVFEIRLI